MRQGQSKTALRIPFTPSLRGYLAALPRRSLTIVSTDRGAPLACHYAASQVRSVRAQIGAEAFTIHGQRDTGASQLAAAGVPDEDVQAITGPTPPTADSRPPWSAPNTSEPTSRCRL